jgi:hypothetical protein
MQARLGASLARRREYKADFCDRMAEAHGSGPYAAKYRREANALRLAAKAALAGDLTPML